jgi:hypothetical protein
MTRRQERRLRIRVNRWRRFLRWQRRRHRKEVLLRQDFMGKQLRELVALAGLPVARAGRQT